MRANCPPALEQRGRGARSVEAVAAERRRAAIRAERRALMYLREVNDACAAWLAGRGLLINGTLNASQRVRALNLAEELS